MSVSLPQTTFWTSACSQIGLFPLESIHSKVTLIHSAHTQLRKLDLMGGRGSPSLCGRESLPGTPVFGLPLFVTLKTMTAFKLVVDSPSCQTLDLCSVPWLEQGD